jgi:hypothetical protein
MVRFSGITDDTPSAPRRLPIREFAETGYWLCLMQQHDENKEPQQIDGAESPQSRLIMASDVVIEMKG